MKVEPRPLADPDTAPGCAVRLRDVAVTFLTGRSGWFGERSRTRAVAGVSLDVRAGETLSIVGESGSGKSTLGKVICGLLEPDAGDVRIAGAGGNGMQNVSSLIQVVFQDPFSALNPRMTVRQLIEEPLLVHRRDTALVRQRRVLQLLEMVGLGARHLDRHPHEFSGGQRQRIAIARAIAIDPKILLADEPLSALDVSVQAQIINLLQDLKRELGLTLILISHDLSVVGYISDRVAVMYAGHLVEKGTIGDIFDRPAHPYTRTLLEAVPQPDPAARAAFSVASSDHGAPAEQGCSYSRRCAYASEICRSRAPALEEKDAPGHEAACHHWKTVISAPAQHGTTRVPYAKRLDRYAAQVAAAGKAKQPAEGNVS